MNENKITKILEKREDLFNDSMIQKGMRDGIELEKGVVLTPDFVEAHQDLIEKYTQFFLAYPDV